MTDEKKRKLDENGLEVLELKQEIENETEELLFSDHDVDVVIDYFWDSHGNLVEFNGPNGNSRDEIHADIVRIVEHSYDWVMGDMKIPMSCWNLYINGEKQNIMDISSYNKRKRLFIKAIVGSG